MCQSRSTQRCAANWVSSDPKSAIVYTRIQPLSQVVRLFGSVGKGAPCAWTTAHAEADGHPESSLPFGVEFTSARPLGVMWASRTLARNSILGDGSSLVAQRLLTFLRQPSALRADHAISEVTLGSLGEFETCPDWAPVMDTGQQFARIAIKTMGDHGSIRGPTVWQKFETCPDWGAFRPVASVLGSHGRGSVRRRFRPRSEAVRRRNATGRPALR